MSQPNLEPTRIARRTTVIKGSFQSRYVLITVLFVGSLTLMMFMDLYGILSDSVLGNPTRPDLAQVWDSALRGFALRFVLYILSVTFFLYVLLHRLAGPVLRFTRLARAVSALDLTHRVVLRETDSMKDLQGELNAMMESLHSAVKTDQLNIQKALGEVEILKKQNLPADARARLDSVYEVLSTTLKKFTL
ncbi:MAG: hypothetical protein IPP35_06305 [Elusimicrobia bacterium]|nr:hypothetical protein [Elusimicrobiota bacterium]